MRVLITDHHLPGAVLPEAACIVNPNQAGCGFPSKHLAGVGVMFYLMLALRAELRARGRVRRRNPNRGSLTCSTSSRSAPSPTWCGSTQQSHPGRAGIAAHPRRAAAPGIAALFQAAGRDARAASAYDSASRSGRA